MNYCKDLKIKKREGKKKVKSDASISRVIMTTRVNALITKTSQFLNWPYFLYFFAYASSILRLKEKCTECKQL